MAGKLVEISRVQGAFASLGDISTQQFSSYEKGLSQEKLSSAQFEISNLKNQIQDVESTLNRLLKSKS
jgi:hypothetical protein